VHGRGWRARGGAGVRAGAAGRRWGPWGVSRVSKTAGSRYRIRVCHEMAKHRPASCQYIPIGRTMLPMGITKATPGTPGTAPAALGAPPVQARGRQKASTRGHGRKARAHPPGGRGAVRPAGLRQHDDGADRAAARRDQALRLLLLPQQAGNLRDAVLAPLRGLLHGHGLPRGRPPPRACPGHRGHRAADPRHHRAPPGGLLPLPRAAGLPARIPGHAEESSPTISTTACAR
jgi:hypothetical protein